MKQKLVLIIAVLVGVLAFWLTMQYLQHERDKIFKAAEQVDVVVAGKSLPAGTVLEITDLAKQPMFKVNVGDRAVRPDSVKEIIGKKLLFSISLGSPIQWSDVDVPRRSGSGLADMINTGMRAIAISVDNVSSVSGMVKPNDHVDFLGTFSFPSAKNPNEVENVTLTVLQDVTILATGQTLARDVSGAGRPERAASGYATVTILVTPQEAELLVFAQTVRGKLTMSLRNPEDVSFITNMPQVNFEHLTSKLPELNLIRQRDIRHKKDL